MKFSVISLGVFLFHFGFHTFQPTTISIISPGVGQKVALNNEKLTIQVQVVSENAIQSVIILFDANGDGTPELKEATQVSTSNVYEAQFDSISGRPGKRPIYAHVTNQSLITASTSISIDLVKGVFTNTRISTYFEDILGIGKIKSVAYSKDGQKVILGGGLENQFGYAFLFDIPSKRIVKKFFGHTDIITSVAFSPLADTIIATGSYDGTIKLWNINSGDMIHNLQHMSLDGSFSPTKVNDFVFSPEGNQILSGTDQTRNSIGQLFSLVWLWDVSTGDTIRTIQGKRVDEKHKGNILAVDFSPTGDTIITGSYDKTVKLWRTSNGALLNTLGRHTQPVNSVAFSPRGNQIATASNDGKAILTSFKNNALQEIVLNHTSSSLPVKAVTYSKDGLLVFTSGNLVDDIKVWSADNGQLTQTLIGFDGSVSNNEIDALAVSPIDNSLFSSADNTWMFIWDTQKDQKVSIPLGENQQNLPIAIKISNFNKKFLTVNASFNQFFIIQNKDNNEFGKIEYKNRSGTRLFQYQAQFFNNDSKLLTIVNDQNKIKFIIWDTESYQLLNAFDLNASVPIYIADVKDLSISFDDSIAFLITAKGVFQLQLRDGKIVDQFLLKSNDVRNISIAPNSTIMATNHSDGKVRVWDVSQKIILDSFDLKRSFASWSAVTDLYLSPVDNKLIVVTGAGSILWDFEKHTLKSLKLSTSRVVCAFSSDGKYLITGSPGGAGVKLWDANTGEIIRILEKNTSTSCVLFEPGSSRVITFNIQRNGIPLGFVYRESLLGRRIFFWQFIQDDITDVALTKDESKLFTGGSGTYDKALLWDLKSGNLINYFDVPFNTTLNALKIFPDGKSAITLDDTRSAILWDTEKGLMTKWFLFDNPISPLSLALSPDQRHALIGASNNTAYLWDFNLNSLSRSYTNFPGSVNSVLFNRDGSKIIAASDKIVRILDPISGGFYPPTFDTHEDRVTSLALSTDESLLATGTKDGKARVWDINSGGVPLVTIQHAKFEQSVEIKSLAFSNDRTKLLTTGNNSAKIWNARTGELLTILEGHIINLSFATFLNNDTQVVTVTGDARGDGTIRTRNSITSFPQNNSFGGHRWVRPPDYFSGAAEPNPANGFILDIDVSPNNNSILTFGSDRKVFAWDLTTDSLSLVFGPQPHLDFAGSVKYNRAGNRVLTQDGFKAYLWDAGSGTYLGRTFTDYSGNGTELGSDRNMSAAIFAPSDTLVITGHGLKPFGTTRFINCHAVVWSIATGKKVGKPFEGHTLPITSIDISSDGRKLVSGSLDKTARIWDFASRTTLHTLNHSKYVQAVAFSPDGSKVLTGVGGTAPGTHFAYLWDANTGGLLRMFMHPNGIQDVNFHPQGRYIVVVSKQEAYVWDILDGSLVFTVAHEESLNVAKFFPDGSKLVTAGYDNRAKVWDFNK